ncbi:MAG: CD225/dispanin family protein [Verrucomicrobiota bacterium]
MDWYYASNGQQQGPVSEEQLTELVQQGAVKGTDLVWNESMTDWIPLNSIPQFSAALEPTQSAVEATPPTPEASSSSVAPVLSQATSSSPAPTASGGEKVPTYLWQSIVCLVLCCLPAAIPAIIYSTKVGPAEAKGDLTSAKEAAAKAKMWCWISFGLGLAFSIIYLGLIFAGALSESGAL